MLGVAASTSALSLEPNSPQQQVTNTNLPSTNNQQQQHTRAMK
jgi:hypothetical protein